MHIHNSPAYVIKSKDYGDGHRVVVLYTEKFGKLNAVARGSRKMKSKFGSSLETGTFCSVILSKKHESGLFNITSNSIIKDNQDIRDDMRSFGYLSFLLEVLEQLTIEEDPEPHIFNHLNETVDYIRKYEAASSALLGIFKLLKYSGYRLDFFGCCSCGSRSLRDSVFVPSEGAMLCGKCKKNIKELCWPIDQETLTSIKSLSPTLVLSQEATDRIGNIIRKYIKYQFSKDMKTLGFIKLFINSRKKGDIENG